MELYNDLHEKVCILSGIKATCITSTLKTGDKEIMFEFRRTVLHPQSKRRGI